MRKKTEKYTLIRRIAEDGILFILAITTPWWCTFLFALYILTRYNAYEVVLAGILIDAVYGGTTALFGTHYAMTTLFLVAACIAPTLKRGIIFYS